VTAGGRDLARMHDYLVGRLSDDDRRAFEDRLIREPELVGELEQSLRMREGFRQLRAQGYFSRTAVRNASYRRWLPALAAAVVAALALFLWALRERAAPSVLLTSLESRSPGDGAPIVTAHFTFVAVRGGSVPDLDLPSTGLIEIRAAPALQQPDLHYRVTLSRRDRSGFEQPVGALARVTLSSDGYVHCWADASRMSQGSYLLRIDPDGARPGDADSFSFNLRAAGGQLR
jgi:hypothetical protein